VGYAQGSAQIGGEVKRASRTQYFAMVGGVLINGAVLALIVLLATHALGSAWLRSADYLAANDPAKLGLPGGLPPGVNFLAALLALINIAQASLLGALLAQIGAFILVAAAGVVFPYRLKSVWQSAGGRRLFGLPAVAVAGAGGVIALGALLLLFIFNSTISTQ